MLSRGSILLFRNNEQGLQRVAVCNLRTVVDRTLLDLVRLDPSFVGQPHFMNVPFFPGPAASCPVNQAAQAEEADTVQLAMQPLRQENHKLRNEVEQLRERCRKMEVLLGEDAPPYEDEKPQQDAYEGYVSTGGRSTDVEGAW